MPYNDMHFKLRQKDAEQTIIGAVDHPTQLICIWDFFVSIQIQKTSQGNLLVVA